MATKRVSVFFKTTLTKNLNQGGAWLLTVKKFNREGELIDSQSSAWKSLPAAKRDATTYIGKRPKWEINEEVTVLTANTEVRVIE